VHDDKVSVLADSAERPEEILLAEAESQLAEARRALESAAPDALDAARVHLDRALIRVQVARRAETSRE
jgi:F0F1-type ATP synthase epsilon subunit